MPFLQVGDIRMHYHLRGKGPPLVLIMGLSGDLLRWERLACLLEDRFRLVLFDNRGSGLTDKPDGNTRSSFSPWTRSGSSTAWVYPEPTSSAFPWAV